MKTIDGLVLSYEAYKEKDALVKVLCDDKIINVFVRSVFKPGAKNLRLIQPFSHINVNVETKNNFYIMTSGNQVTYYKNIQSDLDRTAICFMLHECLQHIRINSDYKQLLLKVWKACDRNKDIYFWSCYMMRKIIENEGYVPYINGCVRCHDSVVETVSMYHGGFLCPKCNHSQNYKWSKAQLQKFRAIFKLNDEFELIMSSYQYDIDDLTYLAKWFEYHAEITLSSLKLIQDISKL